MNNSSLNLSNLENNLVEQVIRLGLLLYSRMILTKDLLGFSEGIINDGYFKNLFKLLPDATLEKKSYPQFADKIQQRLKDQGFWPLKQADIEKQIAEFTFRLGDIVFPFKETNQINQKLAALGSTIRLCSGYLGKQKSCLIGLAKSEEQDGFQIITFFQELARTPNNPLTIAALTTGKSVYIRLEALRFIFNEKWCQVYQTTEAEKSFGWYVDQFKKQALSNFGINDTKSLVEKQIEMLEYLKTNLVRHEIGHHQNKTIGLEGETEAIANASLNFGFNYLTNALEWLSDFYPGENGVNPVSTLTRAGPTEAKKLFDLLVCDNYYYDTEDKLLSFITDLTLVLKLNCQTSKDLLKESKLLGDKLIVRANELVAEIKELLAGAKIMVEGKELDFNNLYLFTLGQVKEKNPEAKSLAETVWFNIFHYIQTYEPTLFFAIKKKLRQAEKDFILNILNLKETNIETARRLMLEKCLK